MYRVTLNSLSGSSNKKLDQSDIMLLKILRSFRVNLTYSYLQITIIKVAVIITSDEWSSG